MLGAKTAETVFWALGGAVGWLVAELQPAFPLAVVMILFVVYDAWTAYQLDKRAKIMYPDKTKRHEAKFSSFCFGKVVKKTIPERLALIILAFIAEKYVFVHVDWHLAYITTGVIIFEQLWSALENNASCRLDQREIVFWRVIKKVVIDKTERHFDVDLSELKIPDDKYVSEEQIETMRQRVADWDEQNKKIV